jgi:hypothetical protein
MMRLITGNLRGRADVEWIDGAEMIDAAPEA